MVPDWHRVLQAVDLPERAVTLVTAPHGEASVAAALTQLRPSAQTTTLCIAPGKRFGKAGVLSHRTVTAEQLPSVLGEASVDASLFDHALDDVVVEALAHQEGFRSYESGEGEYAPWARALRAYWRSGDLEEVAAPFFLGLMAACLRVLRPSAPIILHHRVLDADLLAGQPMDLYTEYVQLARRWVKGSTLGVHEMPLDSLDPQWWLCLQRDS
jgi:hypothetical protein